jgi:hypothetical protein
MVPMPIKKAPLAILAAVTIGISRADIYDTEIMLEKRFGPPVEMTNKKHVYHWGEFIVEAEFMRGTSRVGYQTFRRQDGNPMRTDDVRRCLPTTEYGGPWTYFAGNDWVLSRVATASLRSDGILYLTMGRKR